MVKFDSAKRFEVTFSEKHGVFKKGDKTEAGLVLIADWYKNKKVSTLSTELKNYIAEHGLKEMFGMPEETPEK